MPQRHNDVLEKIANLNTYRNGDRRAPHKPLLLLVAIGALSRGQREIGFPEVESLLKQLALQKSRLEPLHHIPSLRSIPTLMLSAESDRIMPAHTGEQLYESLRQPERWSYPTGHIVLFLSLPFQANRVVDWMELHTLH